MIKPNELRIGNLVLRSGKIATVYAFSSHFNGLRQLVMANSQIDTDNGYWINCREVEPIPLTAEWLERCGFKKGSSYIGIGYHWDGPNEISIVEQNVDKEDTYRLYGSEWTIGNDFKYLHQLQNLYFSLTGEELIKESA